MSTLLRLNASCPGPSYKFVHCIINILLKWHQTHGTHKTAWSIRALHSKIENSETALCAVNECYTGIQHAGHNAHNLHNVVIEEMMPATIFLDAMNNRGDSDSSFSIASWAHMTPVCSRCICKLRRKSEFTSLKGRHTPTFKSTKNPQKRSWIHNYTLENSHLRNKEKFTPFRVYFLHRSVHVLCTHFCHPSSLRWLMACCATSVRQCSWQGCSEHMLRKLRTQLMTLAVEM